MSTLTSNGIKISVILTCLILSGCFGSKEKVFRDRGKDYLKSKLDAELKKPATVKEITQSQKYAIPKAQSNGVVDMIDVPKPEFFENHKDREVSVKGKKTTEKNSKKT